MDVADTNGGVWLGGRPRGLVLETRGGWRIPNEVRPERHPDALRAAADIHLKRSSVRLRSLSATYNCVGLVVASRRAWVEPRDLLRALQEDGYHRVASLANVECGDVVVYRDDTQEVCHVGIVWQRRVVQVATEDPFVVLSQWGKDGEYLHDLSDVPELLGRPSEYWSDRRNV